MRLIWRPLAPGETDWELLWSTVFLGGLGLGALWLKLGLSTPLCTWKGLTGWPCVGCGTTRAAQALLEGNVLTAFVLNPLACLAGIAILVFCVYGLCTVILRLPRLRPLEGKLPVSLRILAVLVLSANWIYLVAVAA